LIIDLSVHSFTMWHHFLHAPGFDALAYIDLMKSLDFTGINLSLNDKDYRHLGGREPERMDRVRERLARSGMSLEIDTSGTEPSHLRTMIGVAERMHARTLRLYTRHRGTPAEMKQRTIADLRAVMPDAERAGVMLVIENHEDFTGPELVAIVDAVGHPNLKILYDYGNSQMVLEDPDEALSAVLPHVHSVHVKDHVMVRDGATDSLTVAGVPVGDGFLPVRDLTGRLLEQGLRRITYENVWGYSAPVQPGREAIGGVKLGEGAFRFAKPPFRPEFLILDQSRYAPEELVRLERDAFMRGLESFKATLSSLGVTGYRAIAPVRRDGT
jgi:sugar phosphate isomerase/epimerase